jgi:hypothetical protein
MQPAALMQKNKNEFLSTKKCEGSVVVLITDY